MPRTYTPPTLEEREQRHAAALAAGNIPAATRVAAHARAAFGKAGLPVPAWCEDKRKERARKLEQARQAKREERKQRRTEERAAYDQPPAPPVAPEIPEPIKQYAWGIGGAVTLTPSTGAIVITRWAGALGQRQEARFVSVSSALESILVGAVDWQPYRPRASKKRPGGGRAVGAAA